MLHTVKLFLVVLTILCWLKFLLLLRYNLFIGVNEMRVKILPLLCQLGLVLRLVSV